MAGLRSLIVKIGADVTAVEKALASVGESAKTLDAGLKKLGTTPIGRQAIAGAEELARSVKSLTDQQQKLANQSLLTVRGLEAIGGPARLMKNQLDDVARSVTRGLDAFRALGQQAPVELQKVAKAIEKQQALLKGGALAGSFASGLPGGAFLAGGIAGAAAAAGAAFGLAAKQALTYADALTKVSDRTGVDVVALQRLDSIARASGNSLEDIGGAINRFQRNLASNDRTAGAALERIGLSFAQLRGLNPDQQFIAIAKGLQGITDPAQQALLAVELFGKGGAEILPSLKADVDKLAKSTVVMSKESIEALDAFGDGVQRLKASFVASIGEMIASALKLPKALKDAADKLPKQSTAFPIDVAASERMQAALTQGPEAFAAAQQGVVASEAEALAAALKRAADNAAKLSAIHPPEFASPEDIANIERQGRALAQQAEFQIKVAAAQRELFGAELLERARVYVAALGQVANLSKLTASEQAVLLATLKSGLDAYKALGEQAPAAMRLIVQELERIQFGTKQTVTAVGELAEGVTTAFSQDEFRNIAAGFEANGTLIIQTLDAMAEHARETEEAFRRVFGVTASLSLALPPGQVPGNAGLIAGAGNDADIAEQIRRTQELQQVTQSLAEDLRLVGDVAGGTFGEMVTGIASVITSFQNVIVAIQNATTAMLTLNAALGVFGLGFLIGSVVARRFIGGATGGVVTPDGIQHFEGGGRVLPFLAQGTDTVPAMLTPGEWVLNRDQQREIAGALNGGGATIVNHWAGVIMTPDVYRDIARKSLPHTAQALARNTDSVGSRSRAGLGLRS